MLFGDTWGWFKVDKGLLASGLKLTLGRFRVCLGPFQCYSGFVYDVFRVGCGLSKVGSRLIEDGFNIYSG